MMKNTKLKIALSFICLLAFSWSAFAAPVRINQVVQTVNAKPGKAKTGGFAQLQLAEDDTIESEDGDDETKTPQQDDRVIVTKKTEILETEVCDCPPEPPVGKGKFPKWALLGLAAIPVAIILLNRDKETPTPTPTPTTTPTGSPTPTPTNTPTPTPTPTPTVTPTPTPTPTLTPTPEPVPEPMTVLLFGTGLAGVGIAARRRLRKKAQKENE
jgi:hypothetical protein